MHYETLLFALLGAVLLLLFMPPAGRGQSPALAIAGHFGLNPGQYLFEKVALLFDKGVEELEALKKEVKDGIQGLKGEMNTLIDEAKKAANGKASAEEVEAIKKASEEKLEKMQDQIDEVLAKSARHEERQELNRKSVAQQIEEGYAKLKADQAKDNGKMKALAKQGKEMDIDLKAVSNMTSAYSLTATANTILRGQALEPGVAKDPTTPLFLTDIIRVSFIDSNTIQWAERVLLEGGAAQTAEGATFSQISAKYDVKSATSKKTAAYAKISTEMLEDTDYVSSETQEEIQTGPNSILVTLENQLLTGDGTGENHKGLYTHATAFAVPGGFDLLVAPTTYDVVGAVLLQIVKANFTPTHILVNPSTMINMQLTKDSTGQYVLPPFISQNGMVIAGVRVVASNRIAEGSFLMGDFNRPTLFLRRQFTMKFFDQNENDAINDLVTVTGSVRGIFRVKTPDTKSFVKGTFAAVKTAITKP